MAERANDHHRRSIRLRGYDYASHGAYFVTACVQGRMPLLGEIVGTEMRLSPAGEMVREVWDNVTHLYPGVGGDAVVIMPNHIHAIVLLAGREVPDPVGATFHGRPLNGEGTVGTGQSAAECVNPARTDGDRVSGRGWNPAPTGGDRAITVGEVVGRFKTYTTRLYAEGMASRRWPPHRGRLWQRSYYEHIIRNERELVAIRAYIQNNPAQWSVDRENPDRM